ncbi:MAG TPA: protein kinase, partial [Kofleriaceae bacterium]|nr:protein kinase [Kofleriaceae bacterium]
MKPGEVIGGRFEVERRGGAGGMAAVYRARDLRTGALVALKLLNIDQDLVRFEREAQILAELDHPAIVRYVAHGVADERAFLAMEWLDGEDLGQRLAGAGLTVDESLALAGRVAEALVSAHGAGVIHRDLKPTNLFLPGGRIDDVRVVDFGVARMGGVAALTGTGVILGTPGYMAPEQARAARDLDIRADLFSLGCVLFECLTGHPAFHGENYVAILAKILFDDVPPVRALRPEVPAHVEDLVAALLAKAPEDRPRNAAAVLAGLAGGPMAGGAPASRTGLAALSAIEQRLVCVLIAPPDDARSAGLAPTIGPSADEVLQQALAPFGASVEVLADGSLIAAIYGAGAAADQALLAARCAFRLREILPGRPLAFATGSADVSGRWPMGEAIERAARLVPTDAGIAVDDVTAALLELRFEVDGGSGARRLVTERATTDARTLLGRATPFVGRNRELAALSDHVAHVVEEQEAAALLVTGAAGLGKSRLRQEALAAVTRRWPEMQVWMTFGDVMRAGSAFTLLAPLIRRAIGLQDNEGLARARLRLEDRIGRALNGEVRQRVTRFLGEIIGVTFPDESVQLRAARSDAMLMADQTRRAWEEWVAAETATRPLLIVLEDVHWGDLPSIRYIDAALRACREQPLAVIAFARPEVDDIFPKLWGERGTHEIRLRTLSRKAAEQLVLAALGGDADPASVASIVARADGNAFFLEELIRGAAEGHEVPGSMIAMVHARIEDLETDARRVLRAASVSGEIFWRGGVRALAGLPDDRIDDWLALLERREIVVRRRDTRFATEAEYVFRHAILRDAAYAMLTERDRALGHRVIGEWMERAGERDAGVLAEHFERGGEPARAARHLRTAAELALAASDLHTACALARRGLRCGARGEDAVALRLTLAEAMNWLGEAAEAMEHARVSMTDAPPHSSVWYRAFSILVLTSEFGGMAQDDLAGFVAALTDESIPVSSERLVAQARAGGLLLLHGQHGLAEQILGLAERTGAEIAAREPGVAAEIAWPRGIRCESDPVGAIPHQQRAIAAYEAAGNLRSVVIQRANLALSLTLIGAWEESLPILEQVIVDATRIGLVHVALARQYLGGALVAAGRVTEGMTILEECAAAPSSGASSLSLVHVDLA